MDSQEGSPVAARREQSFVLLRHISKDLWDHYPFIPDHQPQKLLSSGLRVTSWRQPRFFRGVFLDTTPHSDLWGLQLAHTVRGLSSQNTYGGGHDPNMIRNTAGVPQPPKQ